MEEKKDITFLLNDITFLLNVINSLSYNVAYGVEYIDSETESKPNYIVFYKVDSNKKPIEKNILCETYMYEEIINRIETEINSIINNKNYEKNT